MQRIESVDCFRALAILAVMVIHSLPFADPGSAVGDAFDAATLANQFARFAVPFFFVMTGFFWGVKADTRAHTVAVSITLGKRLLGLFVFWSLIYVLPFNTELLFQHGLAGAAEAIGANFHAIADHPARVFFEGTKGHLWFLPALLCCLGVSAVLIAYDRATPLLWLAIVLYAVGLLSKAYADTPLGIAIEFNTRNGPFFGLIFYASGYLLSRHKPKDTWFAGGLALIVFGYVLQLVELDFLHSRFGTTMAQDYVVGTYFLGVGSAMMALSNQPFTRFPGLGVIGPLTLGIYAIHVALIELLYPVRYLVLSPIWDIGFVLLVFCLSFTAVSILARTRIGLRLVA